jgi:hypothetical protein
MTILAMGAAPRLSPHVPRFQRDITTTGVMLGVPCYGGLIHDACVQGLAETRVRLDAMGIPCGTITIRNESLVQRARNGIARLFLNSPADRLVFIDADIGFTADQVIRLLAHDRPLVGGLYRKKTLGRVDFAVNFRADADGAVERDPATGAIRALDVGTGFLAIKRAVFEAMAVAMPEIAYRVPHGDEAMGAKEMHAFFDCAICPDSRQYLSEDYLFCRRWAALGGEVWADPGLILEHFGTLCLTADPMEHLGMPERAAA